MFLDCFVTHSQSTSQSHKPLTDTQLENNNVPWLSKNQQSRNTIINSWHPMTYRSMITSDISHTIQQKHAGQCEGMSTAWSQNHVRAESSRDYHRWDRPLRLFAYHSLFLPKRIGMAFPHMKEKELCPRNSLVFQEDLTIRLILLILTFTLFS